MENSRFKIQSPGSRERLPEKQQLMIMYRGEPFEKRTRD
jgi:hypothetical protein